jgi:hypothetical protein
MQPIHAPAVGIQAQRDDLIALGAAFLFILTLLVCHRAAMIDATWEK